VVGCEEETRCETECEEFAEACDHGYDCSAGCDYYGEGNAECYGCMKHYPEFCVGEGDDAGWMAPPGDSTCSVECD
jgi:hypothetical protein